MRFITVLLNIFLLTAVLTSLGLLWYFITHLDTSTQSITPLIHSQEKSQASNLKITLTNRLGDRTLPIICSSGNCHQDLSNAPAGATVSDGTWYYYYTRSEEVSSKIFLHRTHALTGETQAIMESSPLTSPRELFLSPDGQLLAFWLDNVDDATSHLTELWVFDTQAGGIRLVAENLFIPDIRSQPRWNATSQIIFLVADTGPQADDQDQLELVIIDPKSEQVSTGWQHLDLERQLSSFSFNPIDLNPSAHRLAYAGTNFLRQNLLIISDRTGQETSTRLQGQVKHIQWLDDQTLIYSVQDQTGFSFWQVSGNAHEFLARRPGVLLSARSDPTARFISFTSNNRSQLELQSLNLKTNAVFLEGTIKSKSPHLAIANIQSAPSSVAGITHLLDDSQLATWLSNHVVDLTGDPLAQLTRFASLEHPNTVQLDYWNTLGAKKRLLLTIKDANHNEWEILAEYKAVQGEWRITSGAELVSPVKAVYEWQPELDQWAQIE